MFVLYNVLALTSKIMGFLFVAILLINYKTNAETYLNPTSNITCGRYDNCLIILNCSASAISECRNDTSIPLYFVFNNDWSVTDKHYNASFICTRHVFYNDYNPCTNIKVFANRTSSINLTLNGTYSFHLHILFSDYHEGPQVATIQCISCGSADFYYSSLINNVSSIDRASNGVVHHECIECAGIVISAMNIYQLQFTCHDYGCSQDLTVYPPIHNNSNESFVFISNYTGLNPDDAAYLFVFFLNGLYGKRFVCDQCKPFDHGRCRIYCGPNFELLDGSDNVLIGTESKDCASIYDTTITYHTHTSPSQDISVIPVPKSNSIFFYNAHRLYTHYNQMYPTYLEQNDTAIFIMADLHLPHETNAFDTIDLPSHANIFLFCAHCGLKTWNGSNSHFMTVLQPHNLYSVSDGAAPTASQVSIYGGYIFNSFASDSSLWNKYFLEKSHIVYMVPLDSFLNYNGDEQSGSIYEYMHLYIGDPILFTLNCADFVDTPGTGVDKSYLYAKAGSYLYIPAEWDIQCAHDADQYDKFYITLLDGSTCQMGPDNTCIQWQKGPPTYQPSKSPTTSAPTQSPTSNALFIGSTYSIIAIASIAWLLTFVAFIGCIHKYNAQKPCCMCCCKPADDSRPIALIMMALGIWDFLSDWNWAFSLDYGEYKYYFYVSIGFNVFSWLFNLSYLFKLIFKYLDHATAAWLRTYALFLIGFTAITGKASAAISLCNCRLFGLSIFEMGLPLFSIQIEIYRWKILSNTVLRNIPQIVLQMLYVSVIGSLDKATLFAFISSACSVIVTIATFVVQSRVHWNPKLYEIQVRISNNDAMNPLLSKRRYLRRKTAVVISDALGIEQNCVSVQKIVSPLNIRVCINDERQQHVLLDVLNGDRDKLKAPLMDLFGLAEDVRIVIEERKSRSMVVRDELKASVSLSEPLLS
eukprot:398844_1